MFFDLFGKNKDEFITAYAGKLSRGGALKTHWMKMSWKS